MTAMTKTPDVWTRWNHRFTSGVTKDGYAVCVQCNTTENSDEIIRPCPEGPAVQQLLKALKRYGDHDLNCPQQGGKPCKCGLSDVKR